ncbi:DUF1990 family protein [Jongsikchunia kroppenstedtii]|uniref:DUF1990 family protein n=1 Tax=Jongsikchunia kroppenstedtii TaxID=1121721 RepID=UPI0003617748|nr:DUF1990 domain-containing protein [Jongsikchunia kroppenstedtii]
MDIVDLPLLSPADADRLRTAPHTYPDPGLTRADDAAIPGFLPLRRSRAIGHGRARFDDASELLLTWQVLYRSGIRPTVSASRVAAGEVVQQRVPPFTPLVAPCRIVYVIDEPDRRGFAYGTLAGHPERGEERFVVTHDRETDVVRFEVFSVSRPTTLWLAAFPVLRPMQHFFVGRFLRAATV